MSRPYSVISVNDGFCAELCTDKLENVTARTLYVNNNKPEWNCRTRLFQSYIISYWWNLCYHSYTDIYWRHWRNDIGNQCSCFQITMSCLVTLPYCTYTLNVTLLYTEQTTWTLTPVTSNHDFPVHQFPIWPWSCRLRYTKECCNCKHAINRVTRVLRSRFLVLSSD
jgi:hypothetical protein